MRQFASGEDEIHEPAIDQNLVDANAVIEGVNGQTQIPGAYAGVGQPRRVGRDAHLRGPELDPRHHADLSPFLAGQYRADLVEHLRNDLEDRLQLAAADGEPDGSRSAIDPENCRAVGGRADTRVILRRLAD